MDEITMFAELRPEPPDEADLNEMRAGARRRLTAGTAQGRRLRRPLLAGALTAAIAGATGAAVVLTSGSTPVPAHLSNVVTAAWTVRQNANGTITIELRQFKDPDRLQRVLREDGVNAYVRQAPWATVPYGHSTLTYPTCSYAGTNHAPRVIQRAVVTPEFPDAWRIDPAAMPRGAALFLVGGPINVGGHIGGYSAESPVVLDNDTLPACVPFTPPPPR